ncbi:hypothetical protein AURDEDRAFT_75921 [Auricularia subglabra TFB-10046 SS5]|nr:hypothetical protein AURDEDRAFT_75921 [Auricularia subglabra TFB-10046 SS5]
MAQVAAELAELYSYSKKALRAFDRPGMSILDLTQRKAHRAIRERDRQRAKPRKTTDTNIANIKATALQTNGVSPSTAQIWRDLQNPCLSRNVRVFLWKGIHGAHKVGKYFQNMPEPWKSKGICPTCDVIESMSHILFDCPDSRQELIWSLAQTFFRHKFIDVDLNIDLIWGCASFRVPGAFCEAGTNRAFKIVVSESAFLAWKIRCEKRIGHKDDPNWKLSDDAVRKRWSDTIRRRVTQDFRLTSVKLYGRKALDRGLV